MDVNTVAFTTLSQGLIHEESARLCRRPGERGCVRAPNSGRGRNPARQRADRVNRAGRRPPEVARLRFPEMSFGMPLALILPHPEAQGAAQKKPCGFGTRRASTALLAGSRCIGRVS